MKAKLTLHSKFTIGPISPRLYGSFIEHMGRAVYNGIYEPDHPAADLYGFREDVKQAVRDLHVPIIRYPGGNFLSGYEWQDGVGPRGERPRKLDPAWQQLEPNEVGTDEFHQWAKDVGSEVMMAVNLGTRGPAEAAKLLEYCNRPQGSAYADMRMQNGHPRPYQDEVWCLGNEMDGIWQIGCRSAADYADVTRKTACLMKMIDPRIKLVACGSSGFDIATFGKWEQTVLEQAYEHVDFVSLHQYYGNTKEDRPDYLANSIAMDRFISSVIAVCDAVGAIKHSEKKIDLSFDEWNVWALTRRCNNNANSWTIGPRREEYIFSLEDALLVGSLLMTLIRRCDRVKMACMAQLINVCAPIMTEPGGAVWKQTTFYPFSYMSQYGRGEALNAVMECDGYRTHRFDSVPYVDCVAVWNKEQKEIAPGSRAAISKPAAGSCSRSKEPASIRRPVP